MTQVQIIKNPEANDFADNIGEFLQQLAHPTCIVIDGEDKSRTRAFVTLLHGNEPSGTKALLRWLKSGRKPAVTTICIVASVQAALEQPEFEYRVLPGLRDLNRCFRAPFDDSQGAFAKQILDLLREFNPEAVVDMHNTSGSGPGFGVAIYADAKHKALVSLFTDRLVTNDLRLGALMEISEHLFPTVTIECGGRLDDDADELAWNGLRRFMSLADIFTAQSTQQDIEILRNPVRLELASDCSLDYADSPGSGHDLILKTDIERHNFGVVEKGTQLGWVGDKGLSIFSASNIKSECVLNELLTIENSLLYTSQNLKLFMITNNPVIAKLDCLFYAVKDGASEF
jgi:hypothetical protein